MATCSSILAWMENPHGQRSLVGYSPWSHKESDMMERLGMHTLKEIEDAEMRFHDDVLEG